MQYCMCNEIVYAVPIACDVCGGANVHDMFRLNGNNNCMHSNGPKTWH